MRTRTSDGVRCSPWRREWDSNPRRYYLNGFQDRRLRPLGHPSKVSLPPYRACCQPGPSLRRGDCGGESGIRTHGTPNRIQRFSRPSPSSTRPSLLVTTLSSTGRIVISPAYCHQSDRLAASAGLVTHRRTSKKSSSNLRASASRTPTTTSQRWLSRSSCGMLNRLHTPPAFRSGAA